MKQVLSFLNESGMSGEDLRNALAKCFQDCIYVPFEVSLVVRAYVLKVSTSGSGVEVGIRRGPETLLLKPFVDGDHKTNIASVSTWGFLSLP